MSKPIFLLNIGANQININDNCTADIVYKDLLKYKEIATRFISVIDYESWFVKYDRSRDIKDILCKKIEALVCKIISESSQYKCFIISINGHGNIYKINEDVDAFYIINNKIASDLENGKTVYTENYLSKTELRQLLIPLIKKMDVVVLNNHCETFTDSYDQLFSIEKRINTLISNNGNNPNYNNTNNLLTSFQQNTDQPIIQTGIKIIEFSNPSIIYGYHDSLKYTWCEFHFARDENIILGYTQSFISLIANLNYDIKLVNLFSLCYFYYSALEENEKSIVEIATTNETTFNNFSNYIIPFRSYPLLNCNTTTLKKLIIKYI